MYNENLTTIYNPARATVQQFCRLNVIDPVDATDDRFAVVGHDARHPAELVVLFRTTDQLTADLAAQLLERGGIWIQSGHCFHRAAIVGA